MAIQFEREWRAIQRADVNQNSSNKTFTVPEKREWLVQSVRAAYMTSSKAGQRQLELRITDSDGSTVAEAIAGQTQTDSLTRYYNFLLNCSDSIAFRDTSYLYVLLPHLILPPGYKITLLDNKAVDPSGSGENLLIRSLILEREI